MTIDTLGIVIGGIAGIVADWLIPSVRLGLVESIIVGILGAYRNPSWLLYFASLLGLFATPMQAFARTVRSASPTSPPPLRPPKPETH